MAQANHRGIHIGGIQVSTEENNSGKTLDATFAALAGKVRLPEGVTTGDQPYAVVEAAPSAFEEAARKFIAEQQSPASNAPALVLVEKDAEAKALEELKPLKKFYMQQIEELLSKATDPEVIAALREVLKEISQAKDAAGISAAIAGAPAAAGSALAKAETPEQQVERLTAEIAQLKEKAEELRKEIDADIEDLYNKGKLAPAEYEERKRRKEKGEWTTQDERNYLETERARAVERGDTETANKLTDTLKKNDDFEKLYQEIQEKQKELLEARETQLSAQLRKGEITREEMDIYLNRYKEKMVLDREIILKTNDREKLLERIDSYNNEKNGLDNASGKQVLFSGNNNQDALSAAATATKEVAKLAFNAENMAEAKAPTALPTNGKDESKQLNPF
jgi:hypothetical protein